MKKVMIKDILFGVFIVIVITILEFIVTIPIGEPVEQIDKEAWANIINRELLLTALPAFLQPSFLHGSLRQKVNQVQ